VITSIRKTRVAIIVIAAMSLASCKVTSAPWCLEMEPGDCSSRGASSSPLNDALRVVGFPTTKVTAYIQNGSQAFRGDLKVGDTLTLYLVSPPLAGDTLRTVAWSTDASSPQLQLEAGAQGRGKATAVAAGNAYLVQANGQPLALWSCSAAVCNRLEYVTVSR